MVCRPASMSLSPPTKSAVRPQRAPILSTPWALQTASQLSPMRDQFSAMPPNWLAPQASAFQGGLLARPMSGPIMGVPMRPLLSSLIPWSATKPTLSQMRPSSPWSTKPLTKLPPKFSPRVSKIWLPRPSPTS